VTLLRIAQIGHPVLRQRAEEVSAEDLASPETQRFIDDLVETMREANGAGLAANQVYRPVRICAVEVQDNPRYPYKPNLPLTLIVNPVVEPKNDDTFENYEGCLSVPNLRGLVRRHTEIHVSGMLRDGKPFDRDVRGLTAGTFQHEFDHLDGKLFVDRVHDTTSLCTLDEYRRHHEAAFVARAKALVARYGS
jgi:peptide deformylase